MYVVITGKYMVCICYNLLDRLSMVYLSSRLITNVRKPDTSRVNE